MKVSRRTFLKGSAAATGSALVGAVVLQQGSRNAAAQGNGAPKRQWAMIIDLRKCEGCVTIDKPPQCVEACNAEHFVPKGQQWLRIFPVDGAAGHTYFMPRPCMQCENPPCVHVCPVGATYRTDEGIVLINHERCIGCRMCMAACPYSARSFNWDVPENPPGSTFALYTPEYPVPHRQGTVEKCMLCAHRTKDGKLPACAAKCPMFAIYLADLNEDIATNGKEIVKLSNFLAENNAFRLKEELGTRPRVWYIPGHGQDSGHDVNEHRMPQQARSWQEQGARLDAQHGGHQ